METINKKQKFNKLSSNNLMHPATKKTNEKKVKIFGVILKKLKNLDKGKQK
tara:strand:- start:2026 stop:2178 length:153 start_codon:yes stop_codon:yes gene_type:complete